MEAAFSLFDKDGGGTISHDEIKEILMRDQKIDENVWKEIVKEVDADGNGEIDFEEFEVMMKNILIS